MQSWVRRTGVRRCLGQYHGFFTSDQQCPIFLSALVQSPKVYKVGFGVLFGCFLLHAMSRQLKHS
eukprot:2117737-Amphidinium_carterae.1